MRWGRALLVLVCWLFVNPAMSADGLTIVIPGIGDAADDNWVGISSTLRPTKDRWVIRQESQEDVKPYRDLTHVDPAKVIMIGLEESPASVDRKLRRILDSNNATVIVDMNLPVRVSERSWFEPTTWATSVVNNLATAHIERYPKSRTTFVGHSAGTEIAAELTDSGKSNRPLFNEMYLLSPRRLEGLTYPKNAVLVFADGDFYKSPKGQVSAGSVALTYGEREAQQFRDQGYKVVRIDRHQEAQTAKVLGLASQNLAYIFQDRRTAHTIATDLSFPDRRMIYYPPSSKDVIPIKTGTPGLALKEVSDLSPRDAKAAAVLTERLRRLEPTPGLGGVSLNAIADVPVEASDVRRARFNGATSAIEIELHGGEIIVLPRLDLEVIRQAYDVAYVRSEKPELSIGGSTATHPNKQLQSNLPPPGYSSVYYYGGIAGTTMGLALFEADEALARLAFGSSRDVAPVAKRVPGFHSMPELFPEKYTDNPTAARYIGSDERIFIASRVVELQAGRKRGQLEFGETAFSVQFSRMGPAEVAFSSFMQAHFHEIGDTEVGAPLRRLLPFAQAVAIFRWLREANTPFDPSGLDQIKLTQVLTPFATRVRPAPRLDDVDPEKPFTRFGQHGPLSSVDKKGRETLFEYNEGYIQKVILPNGKSLDIFRDALRKPVALVDGQTGRRLAFLDHPELGYVLADKLDLTIAGTEVGVRLRSNTTVVPISNAEPVVTAAVISFAHEATAR